MESQSDLDEAINVALDRTVGAQTQLSEMLQADALPEPGAAELVVHRAEDLHVLADEAAVDDTRGDVSE